VTVRSETDQRSLTARTAGAVQWRFAGSALNAASQFAIGVLLARLLTPADFGLMALALFVVGLARPVADFGIGNALVQRLTLTDRHLRTAFTVSTALGVIVAAVIAACAPLASRAVGNLHLEPVVRLLALGSACQGMAVVATALLRRDLDFRKQFFTDTFSYIAGYGGVASVLARLGYGVWSLAWGAVAQMLIASVARLLIVRHTWRPLIGTRELQDLLRFGVGAAAVSGVNYIALNGDNFIVGRTLGPASLGLYGRAYALMNIPYLYAANVMSGVLFPALSKVQADPGRLQRAYLVATRLAATIAAPILVALAVAAPHFVSAVYGPRWMEVVPPLQILCAAGYFRALYHLGGIVVQSAGRVYSELWRQVIYAVLVVAGTALAARVGLVAVAAAVSLAILYMFVATASLALAITGTSWRQYFAVQRSALFTAAVTCVVALTVRLWLESYHAGSVGITVTIVLSAIVPWMAGMLWSLGQSELEPLRAQLPVWGRRLADRLSSRVP
jgi:PST family polysaccharide transporter